MRLLDLNGLDHISSRGAVDKGAELAIQQVKHGLFAHVDLFVERLLLGLGVGLSLIELFLVLVKIGHVAAETLHMAHA